MLVEHPLMDAKRALFKWCDAEFLTGLPRLVRREVRERGQKQLEQTATLWERMDHGPVRMVRNVQPPSKEIVRGHLSEEGIVRVRFGMFYGDPLVFDAAKIIRPIVFRPRRKWYGVDDFVPNFAKALEVFQHLPRH